MASWGHPSSGAGKMCQQPFSGGSPAGVASPAAEGSRTRAGRCVPSMTHSFVIAGPGSKPLLGPHSLLIIASGRRFATVNRHNVQSQQI
jgi:hypothetical protein